MLGCSWGPQGLGEAAQGRGRLLSSMKDAPGDIGHPHLEGTEASPLPSSLLNLLNHSVSLDKVSASPWGHQDGKE